MASTNFVDFQKPAIAASWLNDVNSLTYNFTPLGVQGQPRPAVNKLREMVSISDFAGADPTGNSDSTSALTAASLVSSWIYIPANSVFLIDKFVGTDIHLFGGGTLRKVPGTKGVMLSLTGDSYVAPGVTIDYDWQNADQSLPYTSNVSLAQTKGLLIFEGTCRRHLSRGIASIGASLIITGCARFIEGAPHNGLAAGLERVTVYADAHADAETLDQVIEVCPGAYFEGPIKDVTQLHLNPTGLSVTSFGVDGPRFKTVKSLGATYLYCGMNTGAGNVTGAIDIYNGAEQIILEANTIRFFTYAGIKVQNSSRVLIGLNTVTDGYAPVAANVPNQSFGIITTDLVRGSVVEQVDVKVVYNILKKMAYIGIQNTMDYADIVGNTLDGVDLISALGTGIFNSGNNVTIGGNKLRDIQGILIATTGNNVDVAGNQGKSRTGSTTEMVSFSGAGLKFRSNVFEGASGTSATGIRTNGLASSVVFDDNRTTNVTNGIDVRTTGGAVDKVHITASNDVGTINVVSTVTNYTRESKVQYFSATYDPPSIAAGASGAATTVASTGAALGDFVLTSFSRDTLGLDFSDSYVSAPDVVTVVPRNPTAGTIDLLSGTLRVTVIKQ